VNRTSPRQRHAPTYRPVRSGSRRRPGMTFCLPLCCVGSANNEHSRRSSCSLPSVDLVNMTFARQARKGSQWCDDRDWPRSCRRLGDPNSLTAKVLGRHHSGVVLAAPASYTAADGGIWRALRESNPCFRRERPVTRRRRTSAYIHKHNRINCLVRGCAAIVHRDLPPRFGEKLEKVGEM
jgi:hypothetical protein